MKNNLTTIIFILLSNILFGQKSIRMIQENGIYKIPCKVNGIPMKFIFDTGATDVVISKTEAQFLYKQGLLTENDIIKRNHYKIANGDIEEGMEIVIKEIEIDGIILKNITATIINNNSAPLLLGQSALKHLGKISINGNVLIIENFNNTQNNPLNEVRSDFIEYYNSIFSNYLNNDNLTYLSSFDNNDFKILISIKIDFDDSILSSGKKFTLKDDEKNICFNILKLICRDDEKYYYFKSQNYSNIFISFEYKNERNKKIYKEVSIRVFDLNELKYPFNKIEFINLLKY